MDEDEVLEFFLIAFRKRWKHGALGFVGLGRVMIGVFVGYLVRRLQCNARRLGRNSSHVGISLLMTNE